MLKVALNTTKINLIELWSFQNLSCWECISIKKKLSGESTNDIFVYFSEFSQLQEEIECLRGRIMELLEHAMFGDSLAAEFFLLHILSSV